MIIEYKGMTISQCDTNHHIMITQNDQLLFHASMTAPCSKAELEDFADACVAMKKMREEEYEKEKARQKAEEEYLDYLAEIYDNRFDCEDMIQHHYCVC